jgi:translocation and assembly module TamB
LWFGADRILARLYDLQRPKLERQLGQLLGHPLRLGAFEGLGPMGLEVGPSDFRMAISRVFSNTTVEMIL